MYRKKNRKKTSGGNQNQFGSLGAGKITYCEQLIKL